MEANSGLTLSAANYVQAVATIQKRFGERGVIISKHKDALMSLELVHSDRHLGDLSKLYDRAATNIHSLHALGIELDIYGSLLSPSRLAKLPRAVATSRGVERPKDATPYSPFSSSGTGDHY